MEITKIVECTDISGCSKETLVHFGIGVCTEFCKINSIPPPKFKIYVGTNGGNCGWYDDSERTITILSNKVAHIRPNPLPRMFSFPGYKVDRTGFGVVCHETGHYVHAWFMRNHRKEWLEVKTYWLSNCQKESITNYEPNFNEQLAESFRLYLTNPELLKIVSPTRYQCISEKFGFKPVITQTSWQDVIILRGGSQRYVDIIYKQYFKKILKEAIPVFLSQALQEK